MEDKSMKNLYRALMVLFLAIGLSTHLSAQGTLTGQVYGKVTDSGGKPMQGCTVYLEGPNLPGQMTLITPETGIYRFSAVPPGDGYQLIFELPGFKTVIREDLTVNIGKTTAIFINLESGSTGEEIRIGGESPTVDSKSSITSVSYSKSFISHIPLSRDLYDVLTSVPGSVPEGRNDLRTSHISGGTVRGNQYSLDGIVINDPEDMHPSTAVTIDAYEEVEMGLFAFPAEVGLADGGYINILTKSGGNEFHGQGSFEFFNKGLVENLLEEEELEALGLDAPGGWKDWQDFSLSLGGPLYPDIAWFFISGRYFKWNQDFNHLSFDANLLSGQSQYTLETVPHKEAAIFGKLTIQATPEIRFHATYNLSMIGEEYATNSFSVSDDITATSKRDGEMGHTLAGQLYWILSPNLFFDIRLGYLYRFIPLPYSNDALPFEPRLYDGYFDAYRNNPPLQQNHTRSRLNPSVTLTHFRDDFLGAAHEMKIGIEYEATDSAWDFWRENSYMIHSFNGGPSAATSTESNRYRIYSFTVGSQEKSSIQKNQMRRIGAFVQDSITIAERLTLNLGLRFDTSSGSFPRQRHGKSVDNYFLQAPLGESAFSAYSLPSYKVMNWTHFSPRVGFAYNLSNQRKSLIKGSWSRYNEYLMLGYMSRINPLSPQTGWWYWYDENENRILELSLDRFSIAQYVPPNPGDFELEKEVDTDATAPFTDEYTLGFERELGRNFSISVLGIFKHKKDIFDTVNDFGLGKEEAWKGYSQDSDLWKRFDYIDPGEDGEWNTADDTNGSVFGEKTDAPDFHGYSMNIDGGFRKYAALQLILHKRMSNSWQLLASLVWSKTWGNIGGGTDSTGGASAAFDSPNSQTFSVGRLDYDRPLILKIQSTVLLPFDFILSGTFSHSSGSPWQRTVTVFLPEDDADFKFAGEAYTVAAEKNGARRTPALTTLDFRLEKKFRLSEGLFFGGYIDILNALGSSGYSISTNPGGYIDYNNLDAQGRPGFKRYNSYADTGDAYGRRIFKVSLRFMF